MILQRVAPDLHGLEPRRVRLAGVADPTSMEAVDRGLVTWFPGPASYTGEDVVEFSGHGGPLTARRVLGAFLAAGARPAEPGEFTRRAYLNGKIDLVQAEAVGDLVEATSPALHREALRHLDRHLSARIDGLREGIVGLEVLLCHHIDFPDEDDPPVEIDEIVRRADGVARDLETLAATAPEGERLREGALVVLAGRPNAGKSSLYNALLGEERALVTEVPGTTRDALEAHVSMGGYPVRLVDTAGLRHSDEVVERLGIEVARRFAEHADLLLHCVPVDEDPDEDERAWLAGLGVPVLTVRTKGDRASGLSEDGEAEGEGVTLSVVTGRGLDRLGRAVAERVFGRLSAQIEDAPVLTRRRQGEAVARGAAEVRAFAAALRGGVPAEYASTHLKAAESALEEVVGLVGSEEVLDRLFRTFCIGK